MDSFAKLVFLADKLDPKKSTRYPYQQTLLELAQSDLDCAMLEFLTRELISLAKQGLMVHPDMLATRNFLIQLKTWGGCYERNFNRQCPSTHKG